LQDVARRCAEREVGADLVGAKRNREREHAVDADRRERERSLSAYGSGFISSAWITLKTATFAPMPSASVTSAATRKPGRERSERSP
jgi:hypothetical protein